MSLLVVWVLMLLPLWKGPISLVRSFQFYLPMAMVLNIFLFFCGVSLPGASAGIASLKDSGYSFDYYRLVYFFQLFYGISGRFLFLGRLVERKTFVLPYFYIAFGVIFVLQLLSIIKVAAFNGHFHGLFDADSVQAQSRYLQSYNHELICLSISLTKIPASTFWLMLQYLYLLCLELPYYSLTLEIVASSLAECVPYQSFPRLKILASRTNFPQNLILTGLLGLVGIVISICEMKSTYYETHMLVYRTYHVSFILIMAFIFIILPFSFMKTFSRGRQNFSAFISHHGRKEKILNIATLVIGVLLSFTLLVMLCLNQAKHLYTYSSDSIFLCFTMLIVGIVVQVILYMRSPDDHPWCSPLGPEMDHTGVTAFDDDVGDDCGVSFARLSEEQDDDDDDDPLI